MFEQIYREESICNHPEINCYACGRKAHKHGTQPNGVQRWRCDNNKCDVVTFNSRYGTILYRMRINDKDLYEMVYLFFTGYPISEMVGLKGYSEFTIRQNLSKCIEHFDKFEQFKINYDDYGPEVVEVDEIYVKIQGHREFYGWIAYDPVNKFVIDFQTGKRDNETIEKLFKRLSKYRGKVKLVMVDGYTHYGNLVKKHLSKNGQMPVTGVINKSKYVPKLQGFFTFAYFGKSRNDAEKLIEKYEIGKKISTALIERLNVEIRDKLACMRRRSCRIPRLLEWGDKALRGFRFFHNYIKPSNPLSVKSSKNWIKIPVTPAMNVGISGLLSIEGVLVHPTFN